MKYIGSVFFALALIGVASAADRPNILFAIADDCSFPHMGAYGTTWVTTPAFDRVAKEGLLFNRAYTPNAKCAPSRACILTGRNSWQLEEAANHMPFFPAKFKTYCEALSEHGYFVGLTTKGWAPGDAGKVDGKPRQLVGQGFNKRKIESPTTGISSSDYAGNFEDFLSASPEGEPWCFWYGSVEPHRAYEYGTGAKLGGKDISDIDKVPAFWPDTETTRNDMLDYAFEIEHFDSHLGKMIAMLEEKGQLDNTLIVVTADNGMPFPRIKGQEYEMSNHLPLAIMWKKGIQSPGRVINDFVSFIDFAPTFLQAAGVAWADGGMQPTSGRSLFDIFESDAEGQVNPERDHVLIGKERHDIGRPNDWGYPIRGIVKGDFLYIENFKTDRWPAGDPETGYLNCDASPTKTQILHLRRDGSNTTFWQQNFGKRPEAEFFQIQSDRECLNNLAGDPSQAEVMNELKAQMVRELTAQEDPRILGNGDVFDNYPVSSASAKFYERFKAGETPPSGWVDPDDFEKEPVE
tara:strand:+ start:412 stop:1971 length:1560 start_codon:yes stop_codon:yes gene_type:complete